MENQFDINQAKKFLENRESLIMEKSEQERSYVLKKAIHCLEELFAHTNVEVYLVGSITKPYTFHPRSDVDIVVKNFTGDRFDLWTKLETLIGKNVEVILFENCHFQEHVLKSGYKVL